MYVIYMLRLRIWYVFFTYSTTQFGLTTLQVLYSPLWLHESDNKELHCSKSEYSPSFQNIMASHLQRIASSLLILFFPGTFPFHCFLSFTQLTLEKMIFCQQITIEKKLYAIIPSFLLCLYST